MPVQAKELRFEVASAQDGTATAEGGEPLELAEAWTPEHLLLLALVDCSLASLRFHAQRGGIAVRGGGTASGLVTRPSAGERYRFVEIETTLAVELEPRPAGEALTDLLANAERDCFIGASLVTKPRYRWRVNGTDVEV